MKLRRKNIIVILVSVLLSIPSVAAAQSIKIIELDNRDERVLIKNEGDSSINFEGWVLHDHDHGKGHVYSYTFSDFILKPDEILQMQSGKKSEEGIEKRSTAHHHIHWADRKVWNDKCDIASLLDSKGKLIDKKRGGKNPNKKPCK